MRPSSSPTSCCRSSRWASACGSSPRSARSSTGRSDRRRRRGAAAVRSGRGVVHARRDPLVRARARRQGRRHRLLGRAVHPRLLPHRGPPVARLRHAKAFMYREPEAWHDLMERLSTMVVAYLRAQVDAGADVVQLFDSWVGGLGPADYAAYVQPHVRRIFAALERGPDDPLRHRHGGAAGADGRGRRRRDRASTTGSRSPTPGDGSATDRGIQGNLDATRVLAGWDATEAGARAVLARGGGPTGPHLQPRPRRPARDRYRAAATPGRLRPRTDEPRQDRGGGRAVTEGVPYGVLLMTYGSPASLEREDVRAYLARVRGGREPDPELVDEFTRRYRVIGGSPLDRDHSGPGGGARGSRSAGRSRSGCASRRRRSLTACGALTDRGVEQVAGDHPLAAVLAAADGWLCHARSTRRGRSSANALRRSRSPERGTTSRRSSRHSRSASDDALALLPAESATESPADDRPQPPRRVAEQEPGYLDQLRDTAEAVASQAGLADDDGSSAGRAPVTSRASG